MSVCLCSFRALSRSRAPNAKTLTPFLYQTATIQQHLNPVSHRNASNFSRPPRPEYDVPFEGETLPPSIDDADTRRKTTVTGSERAAFEKLYKKFNKPDQQKLNKHELDQIADEYYEDDEENDMDKSSVSIDSLFDAVLSGNPPPGHALHKKRKKKNPVEMGALAREILEPEEKKRTREEAAKKQARIMDLRSSEKMRVKMLLEDAPTDHALWAVLESQVFSVIRGMNLDTPNASSSLNRKSKRKTTAKNLSKAASPGPDANDTSPTDPAVVYPNYPYFMFIAADTLRTHFPASPLVFNIIPTIKELGRSSYALGASTSLYRSVIRAAYRQNHSYTQICSLLQDMDNGGIEYDASIASLLDEILEPHQPHWRGSKVRLSYAIQSIMKLQHVDESVEKLWAWRKLVARRAGDLSEEKKEKGTLFRSVVLDNRRERRSNLIDNTQKGHERPLGREPPSPRIANDDVPLVDDSIPLLEAKTHGNSPHEVDPYLKGFMRETVEAPVEALVETRDESTSPPVETEPEETAPEPVLKSEDNEGHGRTV